jgi:hypothetical protein
MATRKQFIQQSAALAIGSWLMSRCASPSGPSIPLSDADQDVAVGHRLREMQFPEPSATFETEIVIVGAGVSGLSAARVLSQELKWNAVILELSKRVGGNAAYSSREGLRYPLGAHYLPVVNNENQELLHFLYEAGVVVDWQEGGIPAYREDYLVHAPDERIFDRGQWHDGLIAKKYLSAEDRADFERFFKAMDFFREAKGLDELWMFDLPLLRCSADSKLDYLDQLTFLQWLNQEGYTSGYLHWLVDYSCRDDFGAGADEVSAWAGIHYFAARRGQAVNGDRNDVLTWPEGNGFLVERLVEKNRIPIRNEQLVYNVKNTSEGFDVFVFDVPNNRSVVWKCRAVVGALPLYLSTRFDIYPKGVSASLHYAPWLVANLHYKDPDGALFNYSTHWDNVIYGSSSLGYIQSGHQLMRVHPDQGIMTYYKAMNGSDERAIRQTMREKTLEQWSQEILVDLSVAHPNLSKYIDSIEIKIWGHAMLKPVVGTMRGVGNHLRGKSPVAGYFVAHSDGGGMSLFEEAFDRGRRAALATIQYLHAL